MNKMNQLLLLSMSALSHCKRRRIVSRALNTSLFFDWVIRIELAALSFLMSLLSISDRHLRSTRARRVSQICTL